MDGDGTRRFLSRLPDWRASPRTWNAAGLLFVAALLCSSAWISQEPDSFAHLLVHMIPVLVLYAGMLALFNRYGAAAVTVTLIYTLHVINQKKLLATSEPLLAIDLLQLRQASALTSYVDGHIVLAASLLLAALGWALIRQRSAMRLALRPVVALPLAAALLVQSGAAPGLTTRARDFMRDYPALNYIPWDMPLNLRRNGLLGHLWLSSAVSPVPRRAAGDIELYRTAAGKKHATQPLTKPLDIYVVLCEACWADERNVEQSPLGGLLKKGFHHTTALSPVFGGNTGNAEFEMLTGLPARGLRGSIYMQYGDAMRPDARSLPSELRAEGFKTYAMHNYTRTFWKRNTIYPKIGFEELRFIDDMRWDGKHWPNDRFLFDTALQRAREPAAGNRFFFLLTVHTHGDYVESDNRGYGDYQRRLTQSMEQLSGFIDGVYAHDRSAGRQAMFVVFGDHKPSLLRWFYEEGILDRGVFRRVGPRTADFRLSSDLTPEQRKSVYSVPLLLGSDSAEPGMERLSAEVARKPLFCVPAAIARRVLRQSSPFFLAVHDLCNSERLDALLFTDELLSASHFAPSVYADRLFP